MDDEQHISPKCNHPGLWIEKVIIYEDIEQRVVLREILLKRGLNVIWGDSGVQSDDDVAPGTLSGHSVGKSTFCRLLRHILGESTYCRRGTYTGVMHALPKAAVAAIVHAGDTTWAVMRPIGVLKNSRAAAGVTIDELLDMKSKDCPYNEFVTALDNLFIHQLPGIAEQNSGQQFRWEHLLAWMSRDQEARYQRVWEWRSPRSESNVASLDKSDAMTLMRMVFGLYSADEEALVQQLERQRTEYKAASERLARQQQDIHSRIRREFEAFKEILSDAGELQPDEGNLFGYDVQIEGYKGKLKKQLLVAVKHRENLAEEIAALRAERQRNEIALNRLAAAVATVEKSVTHEDNIKADLQQAESAAGDNCIFSDIIVAKCDHYLLYVQRLRREYHDQLLRRQHAGDTLSDRMKDIREWTARRIGVEQNIQSLTKRIQQMDKRERNKQQQINDIQTTIRVIEYHQRACERLGALVKNEDLAAATHAARDLSAELHDLERRLQTIRGGLELKRIDIEKLYRDTITRMLTARYSGDVSIDRAGEMDFSIGEGIGLSGEAVDTLALVLADITAMRWAVEHTGYHPRFLIHDSPREADLDRGIYNSYLIAMRALATECVEEEAPFQYIVTTTSRPPKRLIDDGTVVLPLQSYPPENLLFRRAITYAPGLFPDGGGESS